MMLERLIYRAIVDGVDYLKKNPESIVEFFCVEALLEKSEAEKIRDFFLANPPEVIHGYARTDAKFPLYAITLTSQNQDADFLGDEGDFHDDPNDPLFGTDDWAAIFSYSFNVLVYAKHPDITLYYFHLLQNILISAEALFKDVGDAFDVSFSGAEMAPDPMTMPAGLFLRRFQINMKRQYTQTNLASRIGRAWRVQGIAIDGDIEGVKTNVKIPIGDDDA
jgi:hypothetical protein